MVNRPWRPPREASHWAEGVANPAYNADRGPVSIGSVRLHVEF
jgi:hypothetical protein